ncbi:response regulator transcription factor [Cryptosporangium minutisporangium]|uniref:Response regulator transcription factor n=1 Tax=Cryptosporangium minutisporangium TaxID=113569 RepID=A0ABP6T9F3_9ACTN
MGVQVAVLDPLPMFRRGAEALLSAAGYVVETPDDALAWARRVQRGVVLLTLDGEDAWRLLGEVTRLHPIRSVIAVVDGGAVQLALRAVHTGAQSVVPRQLTAEALTRAVDAAVAGQSVLPAEVLAALRESAAPRTSTGSPLSREQVSWLSELADGTTVARLARRVGYSERAMFRHLRDTYQQLGVRDRTQAILRAQEQGWFADPD